jgi:hypothetical protein
LTTRAALLAVAVLLVCASVCNAAAGPLPSSSAVDALLADGPFCGAERVSDAPGVTGDAPHIKVIYAYASDVGDRFALFGYLQAGGDDFVGSEQAASQYADQVLHEVLHTLGAVQPSAPHFSGGAHCYQLYDVMCYTPRDDPPGGFLRDCELSQEAPNPGKPLDCGGDDYFSASPAPGSYLAAHWNTYNSAFLCNVARCNRPPAAPVARLAVVAGDGQSVTVSAASSSDPDGAVVSYVWDLDGDGVYDTAGPAAQTLAVAGRGARRLTVAAADEDNLVAAATMTVDEHSVPGQAGAAGEPAADGDVSATISDSPHLAAATGDAPKIAVAASRVASAARLQLSVGRRMTLEQVSARGLQLRLAASRDVRVGVTVRRGTRVLARHGFAATRRARRVALRLTRRQLRDLARRSATTLTVEISAAGAGSLHRRIVILSAA